MTDVKTCIIFDTVFEEKPGHGVAFLEDEAAARACEEELRQDGFRALVSGGREGPRRFWYLKTNAPIERVWCIVGCFFDAYLRFEAQPGGGLRVRESCPCAGCRESDYSGQAPLEDSTELDSLKPRDSRESDAEFDRPVLN